MSSHYPHVEVIALLFQVDAKFYKVADNRSFKMQWNEMAERAKRILAKKSSRRGCEVVVSEFENLKAHKENTPRCDH